jgi:hypothetical protein
VHPPRLVPSASKLLSHLLPSVDLESVWLLPPNHILWKGSYSVIICPNFHFLPTFTFQCPLKAIGPLIQKVSYRISWPSQQLASHLSHSSSLGQQNFEYQFMTRTLQCSMCAYLSYAAQLILVDAMDFLVLPSWSRCGNI